MKKRVVVLGAGGHARVIADIIRCCGDEVIGFLDDRESGCFTEMNMLGKVAYAQKIAESDDSVQFIIGIGNNNTRKLIAEKYSSLHFYTAIHSSAVIASDVLIGIGTTIMANTVINTGSKIGCHCIINTAATVDHDCEVANYAHISPGSHLSGTVHIGEGTWLGTGSIVSNNVSIIAGCTVGAGAVVIGDIKEPGVYIGLPAHLIC